MEKNNNYNNIHIQTSMLQLLHRSTCISQEPQLRNVEDFVEEKLYCCMPLMMETGASGIQRKH